MLTTSLIVLTILNKNTQILKGRIIAQESGKNLPVIYQSLKKLKNGGLVEYINNGFRISEKGKKEMEKLQKLIK